MGVPTNGNSTPKGRSKMTMIDSGEGVLGRIGCAMQSASISGNSITLNSDCSPQETISNGFLSVIRKRQPYRARNGNGKKPGTVQDIVVELGIDSRRIRNDLGRKCEGFYLGLAPSFSR